MPTPNYEAIADASFAYEWPGVCSCCHKKKKNLAQTGGWVLLCRACVIESLKDQYIREGIIDYEDELKAKGVKVWRD